MKPVLMSHHSPPWDPPPCLKELTLSLPSSKQLAHLAPCMDFRPQGPAQGGRSRLGTEWHSGWRGPVRGITQPQKDSSTELSVLLRTLYIYSAHSLSFREKTGARSEKLSGYISLGQKPLELLLPVPRLAPPKEVTNSPWWGRCPL